MALPAANPPGSPPGLESNGSACKAGSVMVNDHFVLPENMQQALVQDVDAKVAEKLELKFQNALQAIQKVEQKNRESAEKLSEEVSRCLERQRVLEAENEHLKQVLAEMMARLSTLGPTIDLEALAQLGEGCSGSETTTAGNSSCATSASPPPTRGSEPLEAFTPDRGHSCATPFATPLPEVPPFPFPAAAPVAPAAAAPLSLVEALGTSSPEKPMDAPNTPQTPTLLSLASSLPQMPPVEVFTFQIRKADETELGLNVTQSETQGVLCIEGVRAEGAVDAWNRQCIGGTFPERAVLPGDMIISVNNVVRDPEKMLEECKERQLLKLTIARGGLAHNLPSPGTPAGPPSPGTSMTATSLRAEASEFVPRGTAAAVPPKAT